MPKTISLADDVYEKLASMKGKRSFSEVIRDLIERKGNAEILTIAFGTRSKAEAEELEKELKEVEEWMQSMSMRSLTRA